MTKFKLTAAAAVLVFGSVSHAFAAESMDADSMEAVKVANAYVDAFNHKDPHAFAMLFTENGDFVTGRGVLSHGREAIEKYFTKPFASGGNLNTAQRTLTVRSAQTVTPGVVTVYAMSDQSGTKSADGTPNPVTSTFFVFVIAKQGTRWEIAVFHESNLPKPN